MTKFGLRNTKLQQMMKVAESKYEEKQVEYQKTLAYNGEQRVDIKFSEIKFIDYTTAEGMKYIVYQAEDINEQVVLTAIANSDYFNGYYQYAKGAMRQAERNARQSLSANKRGFFASNKTPEKLISSIACGFDIEFTRVEDKDEETGEITDARSYMYHWQMSVEYLIIVGRTWEQWEVFMTIFMKAIMKEFKLALKRHKSRWGKKHHPYCIIWVANLPCEFEFLKDRIQWGAVFAKDRRKPVTSQIHNRVVGDEDAVTPIIMFQDCLQISGGSLAKLAEDYTTTQKLKGDLDYDEKRNSVTPMTEQELHYCYNDVAILSEWHKYYYNHYKKEGFAPMTVTGILRHEVKKRQTIKDLNDVYTMFPDTKTNPETGLDEYEYVMQWLFKGGYAHANLLNVNLEFNDEVYSWDITSSYPYVMLNKAFPMSQFRESKQIENLLNEMGKSPEVLHEYIDKEMSTMMMFYAQVELILPMAKTKNTYISLSKTLNKSEIEEYNRSYQSTDAFPVTILDNGRIMRTARTVTAETDCDILTILEMYRFAEIHFTHVMICEKMSALPKYVTEPLETAYEKKARLKKEGKAGTIEYKIAKAMVNAGYGMMCTRLIINEVVYCQNTHEWEIQPAEHTTLQDQLFLNPMWGVWVTAYARRRLMQMVICAGDNTVVCDTDSIYSKKNQKLVEYINKVNDEVMQANKIRFNGRDAFDDLGCWDKQSVNKDGEFVPYERFATMGAKRYVLYGWNDGKYGWKQTIAGLPKKVLIHFADKYNQATDKRQIDPQGIYENKPEITPMDIFIGKKGFGLACTESEKKTTIYHDHPHSDIVMDKYGNSERMCEMSSVSIVPIQFRMTIADLFVQAMDWLVSQNSNVKTERRTL